MGADAQLHWGCDTQEFINTYQDGARVAQKSTSLAVV